MAPKKKAYPPGVPNGTAAGVGVPPGVGVGVGVCAYTEDEQTRMNTKNITSRPATKTMVLELKALRILFITIPPS